MLMKLSLHMSFFSEKFIATYLDLEAQFFRVSCHPVMRLVDRGFIISVASLIFSRTSFWNLPDFGPMHCHSFGLPTRPNTAKVIEPTERIIGEPVGQRAENICP